MQKPLLRRKHESYSCVSFTQYFSGQLTHLLSSKNSGEVHETDEGNTQVARLI